MPIRPFKHIALIGKFLQKPGAPHAAPTQAADRMEDAAQTLCRIAQCIQRKVKRFLKFLIMFTQVENLGNVG